MTPNSRCWQPSTYTVGMKPWVYRKLAIKPRRKAPALLRRFGKATSSGTYFRWGEWSAPDDVSAADVVRFEQDYLGNSHLGIPPEVIGELETRPSADLVWVCRAKNEAEQFIPEGLDEQEIDSVYVPPGSRILAEDGDGGLLVLFPSNNGGQQ